MVRVLIVEDDAAKLRAIATALQEVEGYGSTELETVSNAVEARRKLKETAFDLLILDIVIPKSADREPTAEAGVSLFQEIFRREDVYKRPGHVIGLTAFSDAIDVASVEFGRDLWSVLAFDPSSEDWKARLKRRFHHILKRQQAGSADLEYETFLGVIVAVEVEFQALMNLKWDWSRRDSVRDPAIYYSGEVPGLNGFSVLAAKAPRMGMTATSILATKMIEQFRPRYLAMIGIMGGFKDKTKIGDVVIVDPTWDWGSGKFAFKNDKSSFEVDSHQISLDAVLRSQFVELSRNDEEMARIRKLWVGPKPTSACEVRVGAVATGSAVLADPNKIPDVMVQKRNALGVEMEAYGLFAAAEESSYPQPTAFAIKTVCDYADDHKDDSYQAFCAHMSAGALESFVKMHLANVNWRKGQTILGS